VPWTRGDCGFERLKHRRACKPFCPVLLLVAKRYRHPLGALLWLQLEWDLGDKRLAKWAAHHNISHRQRSQTGSKSKV
jgi:hypothetical protein